jgi:hypothetical protein
MDSKDRLIAINNLINLYYDKTLSSVKTEITTGPPEDRVVAVQRALVSGDSAVNNTTLRLALKSGDVFLEGQALQYMFSKALTINGNWGLEKGKVNGSFGFRVKAADYTGTSTNFQGNFSGAVFARDVVKENAVGSIVGTSLSISSDNCSLSADFDGEKSFVGQMTCLGNFNDNVDRNHSVAVTIPIY